LDEAFWQACAGGQLRAAQALLRAGANPQARPEYAQQRDLLDVVRGSDTRRDLFLTWLREQNLTSRLG
jgi:hypothetical protein